MGKLEDHRVAVVTGGSRGVGAATALAFASRGYDVVITYRNKAARAENVLETLKAHGVRGLAIGGDITQAETRTLLFGELEQWARQIDVLVLNASGGLERDLVAANANYPMLINLHAQIALVVVLRPLLRPGSTIVFVTSHWAHLYGKVEQLPDYEPIAESKHAGEQSLREMQNQLVEENIRLLVVTGDLIEGTITAKLLERVAPGLADVRRDLAGSIPTAAEMGEAIVEAADNPTLNSGDTIVVGGPLNSLVRLS